MRKEILHVFVRPDHKWGVKFGGRSRIYKQFKYETEAVICALQYAWMNSVPTVYLHDYNGMIIKEITFQDVK